MRHILVLISLSFFMIQCDRQNDMVKKLPELPQEFAANLEQARTAPVLKTKSLTAPAKQSPDPAAAVPPPATCATKYWAQIIYPVTICYPPNVLMPDLDLSYSPVKKESSARDSTSTANFYKLSSWNGQELASPFLCTVKGGPWIAEVVRRTSCSIHIPPVNEMLIVGIPEPIGFVWEGSIDDYPDSIHLVSGFHQIGEEVCNCCPGYVQCPDGGCKPVAVGCGPVIN